MVYNNYTSLTRLRTRIVLTTYPKQNRLQHVPSMRPAFSTHPPKDGNPTAHYAQYLKIYIVNTYRKINRTLVIERLCFDFITKDKH